MPSLPRHCATAAALSCLLASPALADLTARDIWDSWLDSMKSAGVTVTTGSISDVAGRMTVSDLEITVEMTDGLATTSVADLTFIEAADGSVRIEPAPVYDMRFETRAEDEVFVMPMTLRHEDLVMIATGDPDAISYTYDARSVEVTSGAVTVNDAPYDLEVTMGFDTLSGRYDVIEGDPQSFASVFDAGAVAMSLSIDDPNEATRADIAFAMQGLASASNGTLSPFVQGDHMEMLLRDGAYSEGSARFGSQSFRMDATGDGNEVKLESSSETGSLDFRMDGEGLRYSGGNTGVAMSLLPGPMAPPISLTIAETEGAVHMPLLSGEETQEFALQMKLGGVEVPEALWSMIDLTGVLPRDPAQVELDISGTGQLGFDLLDPEAMEQIESGNFTPGELETVTLNALRLSVAGADVEGSGEVAVNNSGPMPVPSGTVDLRLTGINALIDNLVTIGIVPEEQAMGARMMLGLFARAGETEDELLSTIELREDGSVLANGQRIR